MLLELLTSNRTELLKRCRQKVALRFAPEAVPTVVEHGIPLFVDQLARILGKEQLTSARPVATADPCSDIGKSAAIHGVELLRLGFSVDQVVHHYGDVCQGVTELAIEQHASISADQFRTLNRCLDEAIADAVAAFGHDREAAFMDQARLLHQEVGFFADRQRHLVALAIDTFAAIKTGRIGVAGATGTALLELLHELRDGIDCALPELRLAAGMTKPPLGPGDAPLVESLIERRRSSRDS